MRSLLIAIALAAVVSSAGSATPASDFHGLLLRPDGSLVTTGKRGTICSLSAPNPMPRTHHPPSPPSPARGEGVGRAEPQDSAPSPSTGEGQGGGETPRTGTARHDCVSLGDGLLTAVDFRADFGVAVGEGGVVFVTNDGGKTWTQTPSPATYHLLDVAILSETSAVAVGDWGTAVRTEDQGKTWLDVSLEVPYTPEAIAVPVTSRDLADPSSGNTLARGTELGPNQVEALLSTGTTLWVRDDTILNDLLPLAADRLYAVGERSRIYLSTDEGRSFRLLARPRPPVSDPFAEGEAEETLFFAAGEGGRIWVGGSLGYLEKIELRPDGAIASAARIDLPEARERALFAGAARGATLCLGGAEGLMIASFNGGKTFQSAENPDFAARWIRRVAASDGECLFAGEKGLFLTLKP